jgi:hypothetical protein
MMQEEQKNQWNNNRYSSYERGQTGGFQKPYFNGYNNRYQK